MIFTQKDVWDYNNHKCTLFLEDNTNLEVRVLEININTQILEYIDLNEVFFYDKKETDKYIIKQLESKKIKNIL